jgi:hypothetical protein
MTHSPFHAVPKAACKTPWDAMPGDDKVRTCPNCRTQVFALAGLSEPEATEFIVTRMDGDSTQLKMAARADGTFVAKNRPCGNLLGLPRSYWSDWQEACSLVTDTIRRSPILSLVLVGCMLIPLNNAVTNVVTGLIVATIQSRLFVVCAKRAERLTWEPNATDFDNAMKMFWVSWLYGITVVCGFVLLLVPGFVWSVRYGLANVICAVENRGARASMTESSAMTKGRAIECFKRMAPVAISCVALSAVAIAGDYILAMALPSHVSPSASYVVSLVLGLLMTFYMLSVVPLQYSIYRRLKAPNIDSENESTNRLPES